MSATDEITERREATNCFVQAGEAIKNGDPATAEKLLRRALEFWPDNYSYAIQLAKLALQTNKPSAEIEELLQQSTTINPIATEPRLLLANFYERHGEPHRAVSVYKSILNIDPANVIVRRKLSPINIDLGESMTIAALENRLLAANVAIAAQVTAVAPVPIIETSAEPVVATPKTKVLDIPPLPKPKRPRQTIDNPWARSSRATPVPSLPPPPTEELAHLLVPNASDAVSASQVEDNIVSRAAGTTD
jgi:tetratricopeptide (TPR) repeat protein